jgi:hypothetical protein
MMPKVAAVASSVSAGLLLPFLWESGQSFAHRSSAHSEKGACEKIFFRTYSFIFTENSKS